MQTIYLNSANYASARAVHEALALLLGLPEYYGHNLDALNDCLSELGHPVTLWVRAEGDGDAARELRRVMMVVEDNGGEVKAL